MKNISVILTFLPLFFACKAPTPSTYNNSTLVPTNASTLSGDTNRPKNIILMVGDGMGLTQITAGMYSNGNQLNLEAFPVVGLHKSYAADNLITDSAAGATAFSCGVKTYNGAIGVNTDTIPQKTILEEAEENGLATGLLATSNIAHATPASFIAHVSSRRSYEEIATFFLKTEVDFFMGGGKKYFDQRENDDRDLYKELKEKGYQISDYFNAELEDLVLNKNKNFAYFTANEEPLSREQGRDYLPYASRVAANFLKKKSDDKGFFLMIEGSQIDWAGHANRGNLLVSETLDFDKAIGEILKFAKEDGETLIIITADHETGGLAINPKSKMRKLKLEFTTNDHTSTLVPVYAYGPKAELFSGIYDNTEIYQKMMKAFNFGSKKVSNTENKEAG